MEDVLELLDKAVDGLTNEQIAIELTRPDEQFGDYSTNVALKLGKKLDKPPSELAEQIIKNIPDNQVIKSATMAGPGFINLTLSDEALWQTIKRQPAQTYKDKSVVVEYSDPNPFKVLHAGHLYTSIIGEAIASLLSTIGAKVHRVNYGGDVGLHVGKTMWAIIQKLGGEYPDKLAEIDKDERAKWMSEAYISGNQAFEENAAAKNEILELNKRVYQLHNDQDHDSDFAKIYWICRSWSYDYFNEFYKRIGCKFEKIYAESEVADLGIKTVKEHIAKGVFEKSDGAIVFKGEDYGLHTRVFINSQGLPTYETKDVGLIFTKYQDFHFDLSVVITGNEQEQYMSVVLKAIEQFAPELAQATRHITHGLVKLSGGIKMSSRKGNILSANQVLDTAEEANKKLTGKMDTQTSLSAVKYAFLKQRSGGDIIYDPEESVSIEGNSGPYLQYAYARACSIIAKSKAASEVKDVELEASERSLLRKIGEFSEVIDKAASELMPHHVCTYLYELAQSFNSFYEQNRVIDNPRQDIRLSLVKHYTDTLKVGLNLLNIPAPEHM